MSWLQRRDEESGGLYGILPLVHGLPIPHPDHIDQNPEKHLLRRKIGHAHSWVTDAAKTSEFEHGVRILQKLPHHRIREVPRRRLDLGRAHGERDVPYMREELPMVF